MNVTNALLITLIGISAFGVGLTFNSAEALSLLGANESQNDVKDKINEMIQTYDSQLSAIRQSINGPMIRSEFYPIPVGLNVTNNSNFIVFCNPNERATGAGIQVIPDGVSIVGFTPIPGGSLSLGFRAGLMGVATSDIGIQLDAICLRSIPIPPTFP